MNVKERDNSCSKEILTLPFPSHLKATLYNNDTLMIITWNNRCNLTSYNLEINDHIIKNVVCPYVLITEPKSVYKIRIQSVCPYSLSPWSGIVTISTSGERFSTSLDKVLIGYWQNHDKSSFLKLRDISLEFNIIHVAFATSAQDYATLNFTPYNQTKDEFIQDIEYLQSKNKKVCISIGGSNEIIMLKTQEDEDKFVESLEDIIYTYGFDGLDINLENGIILDKGDVDLKYPTTPTIVHLINAIKRIVNLFGEDFILTMSPETVHVQGGFSEYGSIWGSYLPIIYALKEELTMVAVKNYNSGMMLALDGNSYAQGTLDFEVSMCEMLIHGFPIAGDIKNIFPGLKEEKVGIALLSPPSKDLDKYNSLIYGEILLNYLISGESFGGDYILKNSNGYKKIKGVTIWSVNIDQFNDYTFSRNYREYLNSLYNENYDIEFN